MIITNIWFIINFMNILIPDSLLREYLQTSATAAEIGKFMSLASASVERIEEKEKEKVYEVEITTNRVDMACVRGFAREAAVILRQAGFEASFSPTGTVASLALEQFKPIQKLPLPEIKIETDQVRRIMAVVLDQLEDAPTPPKMVKQLLAMGENEHSSLIDISNYITHELGHPCHVFDYDKIMSLGGEIHIVVTKPGKKFITLDGEEHQTVGGEVVFESSSGEIIDLPAIKGTLNTAVDQNTKRALFWLENLHAPIVRHASLKHNIRTLAATLNEKGVDPELASEVLAKGLILFQQLCRAQVASEFFDYYPQPLKLPTIDLDLSLVNAYLGVKLPPEQIEKILLDLDFQLQRQENKILVTPPSFRAADISEAADIIEEIARVYGYEKLPTSLDFPLKIIAEQEGVNFHLENKIKHYLAGKGLSEIYSYSMVAEDQFIGEKQKLLRLANPLTEQLVCLRQKIYPSLLEIYQENKNKTAKTIGLFELAKVYFGGETGEKVTEQLHLSVVLNASYRQARAILEQVLHLAYLQAEIDSSGKIFVLQDQEKVLLGEIGNHQSGLVFFELDFDKVATLARAYPQYQALSSQPVAIEDLTFTLPEEVIVGPLIEKMSQVSPLIKTVSLKDIYQRNYTFNFIYQGEERALTSEELASVRAQVVAVMEDMGCRLIGTI